MSAWHTFWSGICRPLDGFLWHKDISHPIVRPVLRNQILASGACLILGGFLYAAFPWLFWFGAGLGCITWIFWSWARFFLKASALEYSAVFLRAILLGFGLRLLILAVLLYFALAICNAPVAAILAGLICGSFLALFSYMKNLRSKF